MNNYPGVCSRTLATRGSPTFPTHDGLRNWGAVYLTLPKPRIFDPLEIDDQLDKSSAPTDYSPLWRAIACKDALSGSLIK